MFNNLVFSFNKERHTHNLTETDIPSDAFKFCSIDFGTVHPFVCLWWWLDQKNVMRSFKEIYLTQQLVSDMAEMIHAYNNDYNHKINFYITDRDLQERHIMKELGIDCQVADKDKIVALQLMNRRFNDNTIQYRTDGNLCHDKDLFQLHNNLPCQTIDEFGKYFYKPLELRQGNRTDELPIAGSDDGIDASLYACSAVENYDNVLSVYRAA